MARGGPSSWGMKSSARVMGPARRVGKKLTKAT